MVQGDGSVGFAATAMEASEQVPFLREMIALFGIGGLLTYFCHLLRLPSIVGFLLAGLLIGPYGLSLVSDLELIRATAEIGVILLLFTIGVEFSLEELARIKRVVLLGGTAQVGATVAVAALVLAWLGSGWREAVYTGFLVALSSTAIVLRLLSDRGALRTPTGQVSVGMLVFQDLAVVPMVVVIPLLAMPGGAPSQIALTLAKAAAILAAVLLLARRIVPWLLDRVAQVRSQELFLLTVVVVCFGIAWLANLGGVSLALGAFLAGLTVSGSRFREHAIGENIPLRTVFNAVFFVSIGMLLDLRFVAAHPAWIAAAAAGVLVLKAGITGAATLTLRYPAAVAIAVALGLAQIGEFSLVLNQTGRAAGLSPGGLGVAGEQTFLGVTVLLMLLSPFVIRLQPLLARLHGGAGKTETDAPPSTLEEHVIIGGYGLAGRSLESTLQAFRIPYVVVDLNPVSVAEAEARGVPVLYGDLGHEHILRRVGIADAQLLAVAINDAEATHRIVSRARHLNRAIPIVARAPYAIDTPRLFAAGANSVVTEEGEGALAVVRSVLETCGVPAETIALELDRLVAAAPDA